MLFVLAVSIFIEIHKYLSQSPQVMWEIIHVYQNGFK